jgi:hypothetical protein
MDADDTLREVARSLALAPKNAEEILREAARSAGLAPENAKNVLDLADRTRAKGPLNGARRPTSYEKLAGFFANLRGPRR